MSGSPRSGRFKSVSDRIVSLSFYFIYRTCFFHFSVCDSFYCANHSLMKVPLSFPAFLIQLVFLV